MSKNLKSIALIAIVILAVSCKKDKNSGGTTGQEILTMKVNGVDWVGDDNLAGFILKTNNKINIGGRKTATDEQITVSNVEVLSNGTYNINPTLFQNVTFLKDGASPKLYQVKTSIPKSRFTFTVTKTTEDNLLIDVEGTFSGVLYASATDSVVITNGVYKFN